ncbi:2-aminoadipate transaminase [compost metagenome]
MLVDTGLDMLKRRLPPAFAREIEDRLREGNLISLAGPHGNGVGARLDREYSVDDNGQEGEPAERSGIRTLLDWLASAYEEAEGISKEPQQWILAESADGALDLLLRALVPGGGTVLVETPAAPEALELMRRRGIRAVPVDCDRDGMLPDDLRRKCEAAGGRPAMAYVTPHYSNPSGRVWSRQRKLALLEFSERLGLPIVMDDTASLVPFAEVGDLVTDREEKGSKDLLEQTAGTECEGTAKEMAGTEVEDLSKDLKENGGQGDTTSLDVLRQQAGLWGAEIVSLGSLERTLTPQLPLAWLRGEAKTMERLRRVPSLGSSSAAGAAVAERAGRLHAWLAQPPGRGSAAAAEAAAAYAARRALALELLQAPAWRGACVEDPGGGLYLWLRLPAGVSSEALLRASLLEDTAFLPGTLCYAKEPDDRFIRLTVAAHEPARLREGLARLTAALAEFTARSADE